jgi:hypothetical protein
VDRATGSGPVGRGFKSLRARLCCRIPNYCLDSCVVR